MHSRTLLAALLCGALTPAVASAQIPAFSAPLAHDLATPAGCNKAAADWRSAQTAPALDAYRNSPDSATRAANLAKYNAANVAATAGVAKTAADCAAKFDVATIPGLQLKDLITLYTSAKDTAGVRRAKTRLMTATDLPPRAKGDGLALRVSDEIAKASTVFGILDGAEAVVAQVDKLPDSLSDIKLAVHRTMLSRYDYLDVADGLRNHALAVISLAKTLNKPADQITGYSLLARSYADKLHPDSALAVLDKAEKELGSPATTAFKAFRARYALIGTKANAITAQWWINPDAETRTTPDAGKVTLIEFTAHWCGPCKNSYPGLREVAAKFKGQGFEGMMVTSLYGYINTPTNKLNPEQEVAADREYFGKEHDVPFPVAINPPVKQVVGQPFAQPKPDADYLVSGIPQIIIVDKKGIIRQIVTGWDSGNTARFSKLIGDLLKEK